MLEDSVAILSRAGKVVREISVVDALIAGEWEGALASLPERVDGDFLHLNDVEIVPDDFAAAGSPFKPGDLIVSARNPNLLMAIDVESGTATWVAEGQWVQQHDPDLLPNGDLLVFDNLGSMGPEGRTRVLEVDPKNLEIVWSYGDKEGQWLESEIRGAQQRLPNGNTLIVESMLGRIIEVTPEGEIIWRHVTERDYEGERLMPSILHGVRRMPASEVSNWLPLS